VSEPKHLTGRLTCVLPIARLQCTRDWRSGFVAGMRYGWDGITGVNTGGGFFQICSPGIQNQTTFDMSRPTGSGGSFGTANSGAPEWYRLTGSTALNAAYLYKAGAPITQVIVLKADNPYGHKFGKIPAIIIVYQDIVNGQQQLKTAVCGNPVYAAAYLSPDTAPAPPTPVSLKAVYNSPLSEHTNSALGSFEAKCSIRGTQFSAYHTGDPWKSSKFFIKNLEHVCFTAASECRAACVCHQRMDWCVCLCVFVCVCVCVCRGASRTCCCHCCCCCCCCCGRTCDSGSRPCLHAALCWCDPPARQPASPA
jgi:hypothetical protein